MEIPAWFTASPWTPPADTSDEQLLHTHLANQFYREIVTIHVKREVEWNGHACYKFSYQGFYAYMHI